MDFKAGSPLTAFFWQDIAFEQGLNVLSSNKCKTIVTHIEIRVSYGIIELSY